MGVFATLRPLAYARRMAVALERIAAATERLVELQTPPVVPIDPRHARRKVEFGAMDLAEVERRERQRRAEMMQDDQA